MRILRAIFDGLGFLVFLAMVLLVWQNRQVAMSFDLVLTRVERIPVTIVLLLALLGGALIALFFSLPEWIRLRMKIRRLEGRDQPDA